MNLMLCLRFDAKATEALIGIAVTDGVLVVDLNKGCHPAVSVRWVLLMYLGSHGNCALPSKVFD